MVAPLIAAGISLASGPLLKYATDLVPELIDALAGPRAKEVATQALDVVKSVTGGSERTEAQNAAAADPTMMLHLRVALRQIAKEDAAAERQAEIQMQANALMGVEQARQQTLAMVAAKNPLAWGAAVISFVILAGYAWLSYLILNSHIPDANMPFVLRMQAHVETLSAAAGFYWLGSSRGSAAKDEAQRRTDAVQAVQASPALRPRPDATADELMAPSNSRVWRPTR